MNIAIFPDALTACHYIIQVKDKIFTVLYKVNETDYETYICLTFPCYINMMSYFSLAMFCAAGIEFSYYRNTGSCQGMHEKGTQLTFLVVSCVIH